VLERDREPGSGPVACETRRNGKPGERSDGERTGPERHVSPADDCDWMPAPDADGDPDGRATDACAAAKRGEHGHELKISATCAPRRCAAAADGRVGARRRRAFRRPDADRILICGNTPRAVVRLPWSRRP